MGAEKGESVTLCTLENDEKKRILCKVCIYAGTAIFCAVFFLIYDQFSHGVRSAYMTFLFMWPLVLGVLPYLCFYRIPTIRRPGILAENLYHSGVAALTVASLLRGIFDIAGTTSVHQQRLMLAGFVFLAAGILVYALKRQEA